MIYFLILARAILFPLIIVLILHKEAKERIFFAPVIFFVYLCFKVILGISTYSLQEYFLTEKPLDFLTNVFMFAFSLFLVMTTNQRIKFRKHTK